MRVVTIETNDGNTHVLRGDVITRRYERPDPDRVWSVIFIAWFAEPIEHTSLELPLGDVKLILEKEDDSQERETSSP